MRGRSEQASESDPGRETARITPEEVFRAFEANEVDDPLGALYCALNPDGPTGAPSADYIHLLAARGRYSRWFLKGFHDHYYDQVPPYRDAREPHAALFNLGVEDARALRADLGLEDGEEV